MDRQRHRRDIGSSLMSWQEFRVFVENLGTNSALFRARHPRTWAWDLNVDLLCAILFTLQGANWQRAGGRGSKPKQVKRPSDEGPTIDPNVPMAVRKQRHDDEISRRRAMRDRKRSRKSQMIPRGVSVG